jgi:DmsE family decaheme c-type cytochrome
MTRYPPAVLICYFCIAFATASAQQAPAPAAPKAVPPAAPAATKAAAPLTAPATFVGSETCGACHEDIAKAFAMSPHEAVDAGGKQGFKGNACESCHGPGSNHIQSLSAVDIRNPATLSPAETDKTCLTCHRNQPTTSGRLEASHARNAIPCTSCHSIHAHGPQGLVVRKPAEVNTLCESCHIDVKASFAEPFKHRVPENAMTCVDCHNPHGSFKPGLMRMASANEPGCFKCHGDKRGPFTFEHAPVREEGCQSCHVAHGSTNAKMLIRQEVRLVCLECHANLPVPNTTGIVTGVVPPAFHDLTSPRFRNCTICHQKVHGSHVDRNLLR